MFEKNIVNVFGKSGKEWLENLPQVIEVLKSYWSLTEITPVSNMTYHYVAKAYKLNQPIVLKIGCDKKSIQKEAAALKNFDGSGSITLLDHNFELHALLLQQALPGTNLKDLYPKEKELVMNVYIATMAKIHNHRLAINYQFPSIADWLAALDKPLSKIPNRLQLLAAEIKTRLLASLKNPILLHGDLHLDNILSHHEEWLCIDPKGVIGEAEFEIAAFDFIAKNELPEASSNLFLNRIEEISQKANLSFQKVKAWTFVRLILSAAWSIEDKENPNIAIKLAQLLYEDLA